MSDTSSSGRASLSALWVLLLLPLGAGAGWYLGHLPEPAPKTTAAVAAAGPAEAPVAEALPGSAAATRPTTDGAATAGEPAPPPADGAPKSEYSQWTTLDNALSESERNGKPVLIDFNAEWCPPCRAMKAEVFDTPTLGQQVQSAVIPVSIVDRTREDGANSPEIAELQSRFGVRAFPTLVVMSPRSGRSVQSKGYGGSQRTLEWILKSAKSLR